MEQPKTLKVVLGATCLALAIIFASGGAIAQTNKPVQATKIKTAPKKTTTAAPAVNIVLDKAPAINIMSKIKDTVGSFYYAIVNMPLEISGPPPAQDAAVTFVIASLHNPGAPTFAGQPGSGLSYTLTISKSLFKSNGGAVKDTVPVAVRFNKIPAESGSAYLSINGHPDDFIELNFNSTSSSNPAKHPAITLVDSTTSVQLDTFKNDVANHYPVKLYFKLTKGTGANTDFLVKLTSLDTTNHVILSADLSNKYKITIAASDWNIKKDTTVSKNINLYVRQLSPVVHEQDITLRFDTLADMGTHIIKLMPSKTLVKNTLTNPVPLEKIEIVKSKIGISHFAGSSVNSIDTIHLILHLKGDYVKYQDQLDFVIFDTDSVPSKHFQVVKTPIKIQESDWKTAQKQNGGMITVVVYIKTINLNDSLNNISYVNIALKGTANPIGGWPRIKISIKDKPFWAEVGTNFDLLDKIKTNNFYAGVYMFDKDIARIKFHKNDSTQNLSFTGGVYESQSVSNSSTLSSGVIYRTADSLYHSTGPTTATTSVKTIGILFSPHLKLTNGKTDENGLHVFFSVYLEMLWQTINSTFAYPKDSLNLAKNTPPETNINAFPYKESSVTNDFRSHYMGIGLPIYIKEKDFNLYINSVVGGTTQKFIISNNDISGGAYTNNPYSTDYNYISALTYRKPSANWNSFYLFQYRLNEVAYGLTFSGEIRGLILPNSKPVITLALSKKFDLSALLKPLVAPF